MSCTNTNPCLQNDCTCQNPCYQDCGCLNPTTFECVTFPGVLPCIGVTNDMNGLEVLQSINDTICNLVISPCDSCMDQYVANSSSDTTPDYLDNKLVVGQYMTKVTLNPAGNEQMKLNVSPASLVSTDGGNQMDIGTDGGLRVIVTPPVADIVVLAGAGIIVTGTGPSADPYIISTNPSIQVVRPCFDSVWRNVTLVSTGSGDVTYVSGNPQYRYRYDGTIEFRGSITHTVNFGPYSGSTRQRTITMGNISTACVTSGEQAGTKDMKSVMYIDVPGAGDQITQEYGYIIRKNIQNMVIIFQSAYISATSKTIVTDFEGVVSHPAF